MTQAALRTPMEQHVWVQFLDAPFQAVGCCKNPGCEDPHALLMTAGKAPSARVCLSCFEFEFNCKHPSVRALHGRTVKR